MPFITKNPGLYHQEQSGALLQLGIMNLMYCYILKLQQQGGLGKDGSSAPGSLRRTRGDLSAAASGDGGGWGCRLAPLPENHP